MATKFAAIPGVALVSVAAAMWGTDALFRKPLAQSTSPVTIVFCEHLILVVLTSPLLLPSLRALRSVGLRAVGAAIAIGAGASALATILFTEAFVNGDAITPVVLQKVQPLIAVAGAYLLLGERPRRGFAWFLVAALAGVWLIAFPHPFEVHARGLTSVIEALVAAVLWGLGTVFGRYLARQLPFEQVTTLRFAFGLVASAVALPVFGAPVWAGAHATLWIGYLAIVTGLVALSLYYYGLERTPATISSLAELAYPLTAGLIGIYVFHSQLRPTQWLGVGLTVFVVALLPARRREIVRTRAPDEDFASATAVG